MNCDRITMSFFAAPSTATHAVPATTPVLYSVAPTSSSVVVAGAQHARASAPPAHATQSLSSVRAHLRTDSVDSVHAFTEIVPTPTHSLAVRPTTEQLEAAVELSHFAADLCAPIKCELAQPGTYESTTAFSNSITVEDMVDNMRTYNLSLKVTVSSVSPNFTPSVYHISATDLSRLTGAEPVAEGGLLSKFVFAKCDSNPHHILLHITQTAQQDPHRFYGIAYVEKTNFADAGLDF